MKLKQTVKCTATLYCKTGLRIGGTKDSLDIGASNPIVRHPLTRVPYIPGSSIKGKLRSLLESVHSSNNTERACACGTCPVCKYFGSLNSASPTRLLVRDAFITADHLSTLQHANEDFGINFVETKTENMINRKNGKAEKPRSIERIPAGTEFEVELIIRVFEGDDPSESQALLEQGIRMMEADYLGGSGGRGYGQVEFRNLTFTPITWDEKRS
ncbi:type III-A CRISPR-associated RAMP protein Csm3 [Tumebacillus flagellatus]|uniref:CRISPR system Cms endoribonuclease Csm3 n=1 Tax=Tumebacillus flagellatus TaxID=1157490 RepID=A0A074LKA4_9BACL|nr:type III-A CRISPR-associated RAMP protein Csm3 [Tumebacillus flagellatus]KEO82571.1 hypothetical protein EL26_14390 [Tumebacillus flagellatus]